MKKWKYRLLFAVIFVLGGAVLVAQKIFDSYCTTPLGYWQEPKLIMLEKGTGVYQLAQSLKDGKFIGSAPVFRVLAKLRGVETKLKAGEYEITPQDSMEDILQKSTSGEEVFHRLTLPEGLTVKEMLNIIADNEVLQGEITKSPSEGAMLPETYTFKRGDKRDDIVAMAQKAMEQALDEAWNNRDKNLPLQDKRELLVLASIVEKETGVSDERPLVASVFINRLNLGMKLQTDPTVIYALTEGKKELGRALSKKDLSFDSPYNTYVYYGLPPAPICSPGKASLQASAHPSSGSYLYFVASGNGGHRFAKSLQQHNNNVAEYRKKSK